MKNAYLLNAIKAQRQKKATSIKPRTHIQKKIPEKVLQVAYYHVKAERNPNKLHL